MTRGRAPKSFLDCFDVFTHVRSIYYIPVEFGTRKTGITFYIEMRNKDETFTCS